MGSSNRIARAKLQIMKSTDAFKETIKSYLENRAKTDIQFAEKFQNPDLSIDKCVTYILNEVQKSGCNGFADDEIYGMAVHYYDESILLVGKEVNAKVVVNHTVELTDEEIKQAKQAAIQTVISKEMERISKPVTPKKPKKQEQTFSLFDD